MSLLPTRPCAHLRLFGDLPISDHSAETRDPSWRVHRKGCSKESLLFPLWNPLKFSNGDVSNWGTFRMVAFLLMISLQTTQKAILLKTHPSEALLMPRKMHIQRLRLVAITRESWLNIPNETMRARAVNTFLGLARQRLVAKPQGVTPTPQFTTSCDRYPHAKLRCRGSHFAKKHGLCADAPKVKVVSVNHTDLEPILPSSTPTSAHQVV